MLSQDDEKNPCADPITQIMDAGFAHHEAGRLDRAEALYRKALAEDPKYAEALHLLGLIAFQRGEVESAIELIKRALPELDDLPEAHLNLGNALRQAGRLAEAADSYRRAIDLDPDYGMAHSNLALTLIDQGLFEEGLISSKHAVELIPDFLGSHVNCAAALMGLKRYAEAEAPLRRAVELAPDKAEAHRDLGEILTTLRRLDEAIASFRRALAINPNFAKAHLSLGNVFKSKGELWDATACFGRAVALDPDDPVALSAWFWERLNICEWSGYRENEPRVRKAILAHSSINSPWTLLGLQSTPEEQLDCAHRVAAKLAVPKSALLPRSQPRAGDRVRVGYLSSYFRRHPVAFMIAGLIEHHDRRRFEVIGYSSGQADGDAMRARLMGAFDRFVDIEKTTDQEAARLINSDGIDILVDLDGYTGSSRTAVLAYRPAPVQVNYIGFPGTMGAEFIDYIIVDRFLVPPHQQGLFSERLVHLPHCYLCTDDRRQIAERTPTRAECGLPETGFVFCCFHTSYKITPALFDIWVRLLTQVGGSVLWLLDANLWTKNNLTREVAARGVAPERLVFAPLQSPVEHLARQRLADLYLDTLPYNANTTAIEALWAGLPLVTCAGKTFAGRMAGSALQAIGLGELVTSSLADYEALALRLAREPHLLAQLRGRLAQNRRTHPLFDTARFSRNIEAAYARMWEIWKAGGSPTSFSVSPVDETSETGDRSN